MICASGMRTLFWHWPIDPVLPQRALQIQLLNLVTIC